MTSPFLGMVDLGMQILKLLAVLGGATLGGLGTGLLLRGLGRLIFHRPVPRTPVVMVQLLGAVGLGAAVWLWVFGAGGSGLGAGSSLGLGKGDGSTRPLETSKQTATKEAPKTRAPVEPPTSIAIEMLGGASVLGERFYLVAGNKEPRTLAEVRDLVRERRTKGTLKGIDIVIYEHSVAKDHPAVRDLEKWARENDLAVSMSFPKSEAP